MLPSVSVTPPEAVLYVTTVTVALQFDSPNVTTVTVTVHFTVTDTDTVTLHCDHYTETLEFLRMPRAPAQVGRPRSRGPDIRIITQKTNRCSEHLF